MFRSYVVAIAALLSGCVAAQPDYSAQRVSPIALSPALNAIVVNGVQSRLKDPASATFGTMLAGERVLSGRREIVVCGYVNAKNSFGGYGGDEPFVAKIDAAGAFQLVAMGDQSPNARLLVGGACRTAGLPILDYSPRG